jgi:drug/metabolite transporter (DMT)-like permease
MPPLALAVLAGLSMVAFAGNSLLCRMALRHTGIDAISFTAIRLLSGSLMLTLLVGRRAGGGPGTGLRNGLRESFRMSSWAGALALFVYALCFSVAYLSTPAASGALLLFGAVQLSMSAWGWWQGERLWRRQIAGLLLALAGLIWLLLPGVSAPPLRGALLMVTAGVAWATYSLLGQSVATPLRSTCGNFLRAVPMALLAMALPSCTRFCTGTAQAPWSPWGVVPWPPAWAMPSGIACSRQRLSNPGHGYRSLLPPCSARRSPPKRRRYWAGVRFTLRRNSRPKKAESS